MDAYINDLKNCIALAEDAKDWSLVRTLLALLKKAFAVKEAKH